MEKIRERDLTKANRRIYDLLQKQRPSSQNNAEL